MALFFLVVGLEIRRELSEGELRDRRRAALPVMAAAGGMVVPAALYLFVNRSGPEAGGWGIPMATDIAFALGALALFGRRLPASLRLFLLTLAIVDDIGAVVVIAVFYSGSVSWAPLAGTALGLLAPRRSGAAERLEHTLHPWSSFVVLPLFALANAGVALSADALGEAGRSPVTWGVILGLVVGKPLGIATCSWLACRSRLAALPADVNWAQLVGVAMLGGIGFTISLFVADLAFDRPGLVEEAKVGILAASLVASLAGSALLLVSSRGRRRRRRRKPSRSSRRPPPPGRCAAGWRCAGSGPSA
jgi:NhaA family Na+:H+ antiporter